MEYESIIPPPLHRDVSREVSKSTSGPFVWHEEGLFFIALGFFKSMLCEAHLITEGSI